MKRRFLSILLSLSLVLSMTPTSFAEEAGQTEEITDPEDKSEETGETEVRVTVTSAQYPVLKEYMPDEGDNKGVVLLMDGVDVIKPSEFPDPVFRAYVFENFDWNQDGYLTREEADKVEEIYIIEEADEEEKVKSLAGIENFPHASRVGLLYTDLVSVNLETLVELVSVDIRGNQKLTRVDITKNTELEDVMIAENPKLTSLDVTHNPKITFLNVALNSLEELDLTNNTELKKIYCNNNYIQDLDISETKLIVEEMDDTECNYQIGDQTDGMYIYVLMSEAQYEAYQKDDGNNAKVVAYTKEMGRPDGPGEVPDEPEGPKAPETPTITKIENVEKGIKITWNPLDEADGYHVYRGSTEILTTDDWTESTFTDTAAKSGSTYKYKVVAYVLDRDLEVKSDPSEEAKIKFLKTPAATLTNATNGITVKWKKITGAKSYRVYRKSGKESYKNIKTISGGDTVSYTDKTAENGIHYTYFVRAYSDYKDKKACGDWSAYKAVTCSCQTRPVIKSLSNSAGKKMVVKWNRNTKSTGYQVQYSTSKTFASGNKNASLVTKNATVSQTITGLTKGKTYYVRMRSYKTVSGVKYYSAYSAVKSIKITR